MRVAKSYTVSNIAVYFYTQTMKDTMGGPVLLQYPTTTTNEK